MEMLSPCFLKKLMGHSPRDLIAVTYWCLLFCWVAGGDFMFFVPKFLKIMLGSTCTAPFA